MSKCECVHVLHRSRRKNRIYKMHAFLGDSQTLLLTVPLPCKVVFVLSLCVCVFLFYRICFLEELALAAER